jgi:hypothetical protein
MVILSRKTGNLGSTAAACCSLLALGGIPLIFLFKRVKRAPVKAKEVH